MTDEPQTPPSDPAQPTPPPSPGQVPGGYPPQPGAYRVIPWIVLAWCCVPLIATLLHPRLLDLVTSGCLAMGARMKQD